MLCNNVDGRGCSYFELGLPVYKPVLFTERLPRRLKTAIKDGFEEMEHEFPFATFRPYTHTYTVPHTMTFIVAPQIKKGFSAPILHVKKKNDNGQLN